MVRQIARRLGLPVCIKIDSGDERLKLAVEAYREGADVIVSR